MNNKKENEKFSVLSSYYNKLTNTSLNKSIEQSKLLSYEEKASILNYIDDYFFDINRYLRGEISNISENLKKDIENISMALNKAYLPENTLLYRSVDKDFIEKVFNEKDISKIMKEYPDSNIKKLKQVRNFLIGKSFIEKGFMSSTYDENKIFKRPIILKINAPKGLHALVLDDVSGGDEKEILINKGYKWKITNVFYANNMGMKKTWNIVLELMPY